MTSSDRGVFCVWEGDGHLYPVASYSVNTRSSKILVRFTDGVKCERAPGHLFRRLQPNSKADLTRFVFAEQGTVACQDLGNSPAHRQCLRGGGESGRHTYLWVSIHGLSRTKALVRFCKDDRHKNRATLFQVDHSDLLVPLFT